MNKDNIKKWVAALRSGDYRQTSGRLKESEGFCCLGVACDLYAKEHGIEWGPNEMGDGYSFMERTDLPPTLIADWFGIGVDEGSGVFNPILAHVDREGDYDPEIIVGPSHGGDYLVEASELNDSYGWTFDQIADAIEFTYLGAS